MQASTARETTIKNKREEQQKRGKTRGEGCKGRRWRSRISVRRLFGRNLPTFAWCPNCSTGMSRYLSWHPYLFAASPIVLDEISNVRMVSISHSFCSGGISCSVLRWNLALFQKHLQISTVRIVSPSAASKLHSSRLSVTLHIRPGTS